MLANTFFYESDQLIPIQIRRLDYTRTNSKHVRLWTWRLSYVCNRIETYLSEIPDPNY